MPNNFQFPSARADELVVENLKDEILIYDLTRDQASCLNPTAALVWKYADGKTSVSDIAKKMSREMDTKVDDRVVYYALEQLDKKHLLAQNIQAPKQYQQMSRRDFLVKAGVVGAAVAIPVVIAMAAPKSAFANVSCGGVCFDGGDPCDAGCPCNAVPPNPGVCQA